MATSKELLKQIEAGEYDGKLSCLYGSEPSRLAHERKRYCSALCQFETYYGPNRQVRLFSSPGRTEIAGNNTDHQNGVALGAAVDLDIIAMVSPTDNAQIRVKSYGFDKLDVIALSGIGPQAAESTHSAGLIRGIAQELQQEGYTVGGFDAYTTSDVLRGSGLSSSAAFETVIAEVFNAIYNDGRIEPLVLAGAAQKAENVFFGKPSGLLDPLACVSGGIIFADFASREHPLIHKLPIALAKLGLCLCITDTHGSHSEMAAEFTAIRTEMEAVAQFFHCSSLQQVSQEQVIGHITELRRVCGDRAVLRAFHFFGECRRVHAEYRALQAGKTAQFLALVAESGHSAMEYNQNAYCVNQPEKQAIPVALAVSEIALNGKGASRLQGTGFAGTIQAFVPIEQGRQYCQAMNAVFGEGSCRTVHIRALGTVEIKL